MNLFSSRRGLLSLEKIIKSSENTKYNPNKSKTEKETHNKKVFSLNFPLEYPPTITINFPTRLIE